MRGKKTPSELVAKAKIQKLNNPELSMRDIGASLWISHNTAGRAISQLQQVATTSKGKELFDYNLWIIAKGKGVIEATIGTLPLERYSDLMNLSNVIEHAFKQNLLIEWKNTENIGLKGLWAILLEIQNR